MTLNRNKPIWWNLGEPILWGLLLGLISLGLVTLLSAALVNAPALRALYILPVWIATRLSGRIGGFIMVGLATIANFLLDQASNSTNVNHWYGGLIWIVVFTLVMMLIAQVEDSLANSQRLALQDSLTGLFNRRGLETEGRRVIQDATRTQSTASVLMVDCDRLKGINDEFGHGAGDDALRFLADTLLANTRESDVVSRVGGDEFVLVLANTDVAEANRVLERVEAAFDKEMEARGYDASLSIGSAQISPDACDLRTLVARADEEMYLRKVSKRSSSLAS